ncbi:MAG: hypothetical protein WCF81_16965 [Roseiarcus sp.]
MSGVIDVAMNANASDVERRWGRQAMREKTGQRHGHDPASGEGQKRKAEPGVG